MATHCGIRVAYRVCERAPTIHAIYVCKSYSSSSSVCLCVIRILTFSYCALRCVYNLMIWFGFESVQFSSVQFRWALRWIFCIFHSIPILFAFCSFFSFCANYYSLWFFCRCILAPFRSLWIGCCNCSLQNAQFQFQLCHPFSWWRKYERISA